MSNDALKIARYAIASCDPRDSVRKVLKELGLDRSVILVAVGKAAYAMAEAACDETDVKRGIVISKYRHIEGSLDNVECLEAGHPLPDGNSFLAGEKARELVSGLDEEDIVLFLLSGGASALFESSPLSLAELSDINDQMLRKGMDIIGINTIRKALSDIKGGRFANLCKPARVISLILSDVVSDDLSFIGSGPTVSNVYDPDEAMELVDRYGLTLSEEAERLIRENRSTHVDNADNRIIASVKLLARKAKEKAEECGYRAVVIDDQFTGKVDEGRKTLLDNIERYSKEKDDIALILCGEMTVGVDGDGLGGRNQHLLLSMVKDLTSYDNVSMVSLGSDGTDGPTDAAGGCIDSNSLRLFEEKGIDIDDHLRRYDSYHALEKADALIKTGPTGTNVNDISLVLIKNKV